MTDFTLKALVHKRSFSYIGLDLNFEMSLTNIVTQDWVNTVFKYK